VNVIGRVAFDVHEGRAVVGLDHLAVDERVDGAAAFGSGRRGEVGGAFVDAEFFESVAEIGRHSVNAQCTMLDAQFIVHSS
jgi:hypothetical protein